MYLRLTILFLVIVAIGAAGLAAVAVGGAWAVQAAVLASTLMLALALGGLALVLQARREARWDGLAS